MDITFKMIEHERKEDATFIGALICAVDCKFNCQGCFNQELKDLPTITKSAEAIVKEIKDNPFNEGIILAGLEWTLQIEEMLNLIQESAKEKLKVMIYTGCDMEEFYTRIGKVYARKYGFGESYRSQILNEEDKGIWAFLGRMILDYIIPDTYFLKCGVYDESKKDDTYEAFGIHLASTNQTIYKIEKVKEEVKNGKGKINTPKRTKTKKK